MNYSDALEAMIKDAADSLWRSVASMPEDKLDWRTAPTARTTRELLEELAMTTGYSATLIAEKTPPAMDGEGSKEAKTLKDLEKEHRKAIEEYVAAVKAFPEADLQETVDLPWGKMSFLQVIAYPYWNLTYHWGQINFIQTMYGDKEMP